MYQKVGGGKMTPVYRSFLSSSSKDSVSANTSKSSLPSVSIPDSMSEWLSVSGGSS